jgi:hypothetical protein
MRYHQSNQRRRLSGQLTQRGSQSGLSTGGAFLFGLPFVGAGVGISLVGMNVVPVDPSSVHAPFWVLTVFGVCFFAAGLMLWSMSLRQFSLNRRRSIINDSGAEAVAMADHAWNKRGHQPSRWKKVIKSLGVAVALTVFLSIFNWWAFFSRDGPLMVKIIVSVFDLVLAILWGNFFLTMARALRFGQSRIEFVRFPYSVNEPILLRWQVANGISKPIKGSFTLRCVEERWETTESGGERNTTLIHDEVWSGTWELESADEELLPNKTREFRFEPTINAMATNFRAKQPIYWEFEVKIKLSGPNFVETYLVPVYD